MNASERSRLVKERSLELGFSAVGIADLGPNCHGEHLKQWLSRGMAGTMLYMHRQAKRRVEPARILNGATHAVVVMRNHFSVDPPKLKGTGRIAKYARGPDYHDALQAPLEQLANHVRALGDAGTIARTYVDAGPVPERELAQRAGLGWIGRNSMLINPKLGSHHFLATVLTNVELAVDAPWAADRCGTCQRCVASCPTNAIDPARMIDSRICISYLTIEYKGRIPKRLQTLMGDWIFGCDVCQDVCPWNVKFARPANDPVLAIDSNRGQEQLEYLCKLTPELFSRRFGATPLARAGLAGIKRNARIARGNEQANAKRAESKTKR